MNLLQTNILKRNEHIFLALILRSWLNDVIFAVIIIQVMNLFKGKEIGVTNYKYKKRFIRYNKDEMKNTGSYNGL